MMSGLVECIRCGGVVNPEGICSVCGTHNYNENTGNLPAADHLPFASQDPYVLPAQDELEAPNRPASLFDKATGTKFALNRSVNKVGRDRTNNIAITNDHYISRYHAWVLHMRGKYFVEDLGSTNGTLLNGEALSERKQIFAGDRITFGKTEMVFGFE